MSAATEPSTGLDLATVWETVADTVPDAPALVHGDVERSWSRFERRAAGLAAHLVAAGVGHDDKVACYLYNGPEYLETMFGSFKARAVPFNVNYRYLDEELRYLFDNADAAAVVVDAALVDRVERIRGSLPLLRTVVVVGADDAHPLPEWAADYEEVVAGEPMPRIDRSGEDLWFLYTGGTTGMPKGVMWPQRNLLATSAATFAVVDRPVPSTREEVADAVAAFHERGKAVRLLPAAPLMHGTSAITAVAVLSAGGTVVTLTSRSFDGDELCATVQRHRVTQLTIVGDAFARPILDALRAAADRGEPYDLSSLKVIVSSGVMWSREAKEELLEWCSATLADTLGSSEGVGMAASVSRRGATAGTATFRLGENARVFTPEGTDVRPGSGERGLLAVGGPIPVGYYKDPDKTAGTFRTIGGRTWSVPGDEATVEADGTIRLLGRGSVCINTAGEKVYPEEVEEVLKLHPGVADCNVVGVPDERWGQSVTAVVQLADGAAAEPSDAPDAAQPTDRPASLLADVSDAEALLVAHTKEHLAGYKCPKRVVVVDRVRRGPNGKPDYRWALEVATAG